MFLPLFADSERAASSGLDYLKSQLASEFYTVAWPLDRALPLSDQRLQLLGNLDDAIGKLPPDAVVVLDATGSLRQDLALSVIAYVNHRREPLKSAGLRLVLCWPTDLKNELLSKAPDLWSVRVASPWVEEVNVPQTQDRFAPSADSTGMLPSASAASRKKLVRWQKYRNLKLADLSPSDALNLAGVEYQQRQWHQAIELAETVLLVLNEQNQPLNDAKLQVDALNIIGAARSNLGNHIAALEADKKAVFLARQLVQANSAGYEPSMAMSINNLASALRDTGDRHGAVNAAQEAVNIYVRLTKVNPAYQSQLANSVSNLAGFLAETGDRLGALRAAQYGVKIRRS